jgi:NADH-quinone oxidoreductase subunit G
MPKLTIDNREIVVADGTKVIVAAEHLGIVIPRFCYHPALGAVGACRVCAVSFLEGPVKGVQMSCMIEAKDGMVVSTTDEAALVFRRSVIEWLMRNHPHDCPVCDEGGHCLLQDLTVSGGHSQRRYLGPKRTYQDQNLGPLLQHEMNRCIHCYRCVRYYQEFCGYYDLGVLGLGSRTYFGRHQEGVLENPFSGNLSDICPTGVFTDKPSRYSGRRWDFERKPSLCIQCALGCNTTVSARYRQVRRQEARFNPWVNGHFICDRGRYGFNYTNIETRPRKARIDNQHVPINKALSEAQKGLTNIVDEHGTHAVTALSSPRSTLEVFAMLNRIARLGGWQNPAFFGDTDQAETACAMVARLEPDLAIAQQQIQTADVIVVLGADPINEAPMLALALRQAKRKGAKIMVVDPRPVSLPFDFQHLPLAPGALVPFLAVLTQTTVLAETAAKLGVADCYKAIAAIASDASAAAKKAATHVGPVVKNSKRPLIVCGIETLKTTGVHLAADYGLMLRAAKKNARLFFVSTQANAFGAGLTSADANSFEKILNLIENDGVKALLVVEADCEIADRARVEAALKKLDLLIVIDYLETWISKKADIFLPAATLYEAGGSFINQEGRIQKATAVIAGGRPVRQTGGGQHPPRNYGEGLPGADQLPGWQALAQIGQLPLSSAKSKNIGEIRGFVADVLPKGQSLVESDTDLAGSNRCGLGPNPLKRFSTGHYKKRTEGTSLKKENALALMRVEWSFGTEVFSGYASCLAPVTPAPGVFMHTETAAKLNFENGQNTSIETPYGTITAPLNIVTNMAPGVVVLPRHHALEWHKLGPGEILLSPDQIKKV